MTIRRATEADRDLLRTLSGEFALERPPPPYVRLDDEERLADVDKALAGGAAFVAELDGDPVGFALAFPRPSEVFLEDLFVRPHVRRRGIGRALVQAVGAYGREREKAVMTLNVDTGNAEALGLYRALGFRDESLYLAADLSALEAALGTRAEGASFGSIHVQTDDAGAVERAVGQFLPRLPGESKGTVVVPPRNGWTSVYDELCDREPELLRRLARELSDRLGVVVLALGVERGAVVHYVLYERRRVMDEYRSLPEYDGPRAPGDVVALGANPTVVARLTGANPAEVRRVARTGKTPGDVPPARDLLRDLAAAMGVEGGDHGFALAGA